MIGGGVMVAAHGAAPQRGVLSFDGGFEGAGREPAPLCTVLHTSEIVVLGGFGC